MGNLRRLKDGEDFGPEHFGSEDGKNFGFTGSSEGYDPHPVAPPFAGGKPDSGPHHSVETTPAYAHGGHVHPHGHHVVRVEHGEHGVIHHHAHGGFTHFHPDGAVTHHGHDGQAIHHAGQHGQHPGEGTHVEKLMASQHEEPDGDEGMARGGRAPRIPRSMRPKAESVHSPIETPPRNPMRSPARRNSMPGGQMPYGVEPSAEPDEAGSEQGIPQLKHGGQAHKARGGKC